jgi:hypothetical protein
VHNVDIVNLLPTSVNIFPFNHMCIMLTFSTFKPLVYNVDTVIVASILLIMGVPDEDFSSKNSPWSLSLISSFVFPDHYVLHFNKSVAFYSTLNSSYSTYSVHLGVVERNCFMFWSLRNKLSILIDVAFHHCLNY